MSYSLPYGWRTNRTGNLHIEYALGRGYTVWVEGEVLVRCRNPREDRTNERPFLPAWPPPLASGEGGGPSTCGRQRYAPSSRFSPQLLRSACMPQRGRSSHIAAWWLPLRCGRGSVSHPHPPEGECLKSQKNRRGFTAEDRFLTGLS